MNAIPIEAIQDLKCIKSLNAIKKQFVFKLDNRKRLYNYLNICDKLGIDKFCQTCNPTQINREIIKELISN